MFQYRNLGKGEPNMFRTSSSKSIRSFENKRNDTHTFAAKDYLYDNTLGPIESDRVTQEDDTVRPFQSFNDFSAESNMAAVAS